MSLSLQELSFWLFLLLSEVESRWILQVGVHHYNNQASIAADNGFNCCDLDGISDGQCTNECDNYFIFCLQSVDTLNDNICPYGEYTTGIVGGDELDFTIGQELSTGVPNPLIFHGNMWPTNDQLQLRIRIFDNDPGPGNDDLVSTILVNWRFSNVSNGKSAILTYTGSAHSISIGIDFNLLCDQFYYGAKCEVFCQPHNDTRGHYTCDEQGNIVCNRGYTGEQTNCTTPICQPNCTSNGRCVTPNICQCLDGWTGPTCAVCVNCPPSLYLAPNSSTLYIMSASSADGTISPSLVNTGGISTAGSMFSPSLASTVGSIISSSLVNTGGSIISSSLVNTGGSIISPSLVNTGGSIISPSLVNTGGNQFSMPVRMIGILIGAVVGLIAMLIAVVVIFAIILIIRKRLHLPKTEGCDSRISDSIENPNYTMTSMGSYTNLVTSYCKTQSEGFVKNLENPIYGHTDQKPYPKDEVPSHEYSKTHQINVQSLPLSVHITNADNREYSLAYPSLNANVYSNPESGDIYYSTPDEGNGNSFQLYDYAETGASGTYVPPQNSLDPLFSRVVEAGHYEFHPNYKTSQ